MELKSYIKILPFVGRHMDYVIGPEVEITEKLDGSQFCFGKDEEGNILCRSKGAPIDMHAPPAMFAAAVAHVEAMAHRIPPNMAFYAEMLNKLRHNSLTYERIPRNGIALYGITDFHRTESLASEHSTLVEWAEVLECETVPLIYKGVLRDLEHAKSMMGGISVLGKAIKEGIVVKNYGMSIEFNGQIFPFVAVKYVSEEFKEVHRSNPDWTSAKDNKLLLLEQYRTEARWKKALFYLRDNGELVGEPRDIGKLIPRIIEDLLEEEKEDFKECLFNIYKKEWLSTATRGSAEWYKNYLMNPEEKVDAE